VAGGPAAIAAAAAGGFGLYDDLAGDSHARGLRGHARAALEGRLTTGLIKLAGLTAGGCVAAAVNARHQRVTTPAVVATDALLIAGMANLINLLDLRPGRAAKVSAVVAAPLAFGRGRGAAPAAAAVAATLAVLPADLAESVMLGDCGANALGATLGASMCASLPARGRMTALCAVVAATLASERMSFTEVIDRTPLLAALDRLGRRP
jgi:UDP-N-acetylmuramyl pentapeptide phosphotransferase/UDP-N-acetylglucosamine-1-phosphate transferase